MHSILLEEILVQMFKIPLWRGIDNATSYFLISSKNLKWKQELPALEYGYLGWLAHSVSRFACNTRVMVNASSNPPVSRLKLL